MGFHNSYSADDEQFFGRPLLTYRILMVFSFILLSYACSHTVNFATEPVGATVFLLDGKGERGSPLGVTPVKIEVDRWKAHSLYELRKDGYEATTLVVPFVGGARQVQFVVKLKPHDNAWFRERLLQDQAGVLSSQFMQLLQLQNAILQGGDGEVVRLIDLMKTDFARVSAWNSLVGNYHFIKGDGEKARLYYKRAYELDPTNQEARSMLNNLRDRGGK